ncbi:hypothetical protein ACJX0J_029979, partial [Zea mays]
MLLLGMLHYIELRYFHKIFSIFLETRTFFMNSSLPLQSKVEKKYVRLEKRISFTFSCCYGTATYWVNALASGTCGVSKYIQKEWSVRYFENGSGVVLSNKAYLILHRDPKE